MENAWLDDDCAKAFWDQQLAVPYRELLKDTIAQTDPRDGEHWLDLGCGGGPLTAALWERCQGHIGRIVCMDCAAINVQAIDRLRRRLRPEPAPHQIQFLTGNFSDGLPQFADDSFDGIVSGLSISYAEAIDAKTGRYCDSAYRRVYEEMSRILKPGGQLVFSVNVPNPRFWKIVMKSLGRTKISKPGRTLVNTWRMMRWGREMCRYAESGRFHYWTADKITELLEQVGFEGVGHRMSYADQAYVFSARRSYSEAYAKAS